MTQRFSAREDWKETAIKEGPVLFPPPVTEAPQLSKHHGRRSWEENNNVWKILMKTITSAVFAVVSRVGVP